uniref:Uncharacterized protein n=1 Tax=Romanomermis culicivorax TaxID=13658 RepID=A0A915HZ71_ROMCU
MDVQLFIRQSSQTITDDQQYRKTLNCGDKLVKILYVLCKGCFYGGGIKPQHDRRLLSRDDVRIYNNKDHADGKERDLNSSSLTDLLNVASPIRNIDTALWISKCLRPSNLQSGILGISTFALMMMDDNDCDE